MDGETMMAFLQTHWYIVSMVMGVVVLMGAILNWNWLRDPTDAPRSHRYSRGSRRVIFFLMGVALIVVGIWCLVLALK